MVEQQTRNQSKTSVAAAFSDFVHYSWIWTRIEKSLEKMNIVHCTQLNEGINLFCAFISECHPLKNWFAPIWSLKRMLIMISKNNKYMFGLDYIYMLSAGQILPTCNATHVTARHRNASRPRPSHTSNMILPGTDRSAVELWWCVVNIFVNTSTQWEYSLYENVQPVKGFWPSTNYCFNYNTSLLFGFAVSKNWLCRFVSFVM